jgi:hypothetical protein
VLLLFITGASEFHSREFIAQGVEAIAPTKISPAIRLRRNLSGILEKKMRIFEALM